MTFAIVWADEAFAAAHLFRGDDPVGLADVFDAVHELREDPRPSAARPWGGTDLLRLRVGRYRVLYEIDDNTVRIDILHPGRTA